MSDFKVGDSVIYTDKYGCRLGSVVTELLASGLYRVQTEFETLVVCKKEELTPVRKAYTAKFRKLVYDVKASLKAVSTEYLEEGDPVWLRTVVVDDPPNLSHIVEVPGHVNRVHWQDGHDSFDITVLDQGKNVIKYRVHHSDVRYRREENMKTTTKNKPKKTKKPVSKKKPLELFDQVIVADNSGVAWAGTLVGVDEVYYHVRLLCNDQVRAFFKEVVAKKE